MTNSTDTSADITFTVIAGGVMLSVSGLSGCAILDATGRIYSYGWPSSIYATVDAFEAAGHATSGYRNQGF